MNQTHACVYMHIHTFTSISNQAVFWAHVVSFQPLTNIYHRNIQHKSATLLAELCNIIHGCNQQGMFAATFSLGWPGSVMPLSKTFKATSHIPCCAHAIPLPSRAAKGLDCVFPIWFTQCGRVWFKHAMPCSCHATTMLFWKWLLKAAKQHGMGAEWAWHGMCELASTIQGWHVGVLPVFRFFQLSHSSMKVVIWSIPIH
jgi:hypothetical protein